jgi:Arc/MetJ family transcription regulator
MTGERRKTTVEIDLDALREAAGFLGTTGLKETINAALHDVVRRAELDRGADFLLRPHEPGPTPPAHRDD